MLLNTYFGEIEVKHSSPNPSYQLAVCDPQKVLEIVQHHQSPLCEDFTQLNERSHHGESDCLCFQKPDNLPCEDLHPSSPSDVPSEDTVAANAGGIESTSEDVDTFMQSPLHLDLLSDDEYEDTFAVEVEEEEEEVEEDLVLDIKASSNNSTSPVEEMRRETNLCYSLASVQGNRTHMLDKASFLPSLGNESYYAVFDGHGNAAIAEYLESNLLSLIKSHSAFHFDVKQAIIQTFLELDAMFVNDDLRFGGSGCVCVCALVINESLYIANLGDCRAVLFDRWGNQLNLSVDHTPETRSDEVQRILKSNGVCFRKGSHLRVAGELNVTRAFGDKQYKPYVIADPEVFVYDINTLLANFQYQDVFLVLASDGLWSEVDSFETVCADGYTAFPEKSLQKIIAEKECFRDNITILSVNLQFHYLAYLGSQHYSQFTCDGQGAV